MLLCEPFVLHLQKGKVELIIIKVGDSRNTRTRLRNSGDRIQHSNVVKSLEHVSKENQARQFSS